MSAGLHLGGGARSFYGSRSLNDGSGGLCWTKTKFPSSTDQRSSELAIPGSIVGLEWGPGESNSMPRAGSPGTHRSISRRTRSGESSRRR